MRFRLEAGLAVLGAAAALATALWPDWIELIFHWSPDHGSGRSEWLVVLVSAVTATASSTLATREWRKAHSV